MGTHSLLHSTTNNLIESNQPIPTMKSAIFFLVVLAVYQIDARAQFLFPSFRNGNANLFVASASGGSSSSSSNGGFSTGNGQGFGASNPLGFQAFGNGNSNSGG